MKIRIIPHGPDRHDSVHAFNMRMRAGGSRWGFYPESTCEWLPHGECKRVWREYHLAVDDNDVVRGGFALKPQPWMICGVEHIVTDWQGPFSEGAIDNKYAAMGLRLVRGMLKMRPLLFSWGHGDDDAPIVQMLRKMGWLTHATPVCVLVVRPFKFLRMAQYLRTSGLRRRVLDVLAFSGAGWIGARAFHTYVRWTSSPRPARGTLDAVVVTEFGPWADALWERCSGEYLALAVRDAEVMNLLLPSDGRWPESIKLRVSRDGEDIGWAALRDTQMANDDRFGSLRVGSVIDCFAHPDDAADVLHAATEHLRSRGVDLIISNQSHPGWVRGFAANGYAVFKNKRLFAISPQLQSAMDPWDEVSKGLHLTNLDGHGPHLL